MARHYPKGAGICQSQWSNEVPEANIYVAFQLGPECQSSSGDFQQRASVHASNFGQSRRESDEDALKSIIAYLFSEQLVHNYLE